MGGKVKASLAVILSLCISFIAGTVMVSAEENANDLFKLYDKERVERYENTIRNYEELQTLLIEANEDVEKQELFFSLYEAARVEQLKRIDELNSEINSILKENIEIAKCIEEEFSIASWEDLLAHDRQYKINSDVIASLLDKRDSVVLLEEISVDYSIHDMLERDLFQAKQEFDNLEDLSILGDVTNVKYPLGEETMVTSGYGYRIDPIDKESITFHNGIDLKANTGTEVLSIFNGVVSKTGFGPLGGYYVWIDHGNGISSYYCHLDEIKCRVGQKVSQYDVIALSGNTGSRTTGAHLHFGIYIDDVSVNPEVLF